MTRDLHGLFSPKSVAIIGASKSPEKVGAIVLKNIIDSGYKGMVYPVNPKDTDISGLKCYPDVNSLPEIPDLAVFAIPSAVAISVLEEVGKKGIKNAVIFSAGFKEIGGEGELLQKQLVDIANKYQINVLGPNCLGFANNNVPINVTFGQVVKQTGNLRIISQSGAIAASLFDWCETTKLGFSEFVTIGNKAVVDENDILNYWASLPAQPTENGDGLSHVSPIGLYLESIANGTEFVKIATEISKSTPIFALKPGKSKAAATAMHSHTGAIAGEDSVLDIALKQSGVIRCMELGEFFDVARAFAWENAPHGPRVAIVSNAGGPAVLSTDSISESGLEMAVFSGETQQKLSAFLPRMASFLNPVDVLGDALADRFGQALDAVLQEPTVDAAIVILTPQLMTQIEKTAEIIGNVKEKSKPILCSFIGGSLAAVGEKKLNEFKIPTFPFPEMAIKTLSSMWQWQSWRDTQSKNIVTPEIPMQQNIDTVKNILSSAKNSYLKNLDNFSANDVMTAAGIQTPPTAAVADIDQAELFANGAGWPIVLKVSSPGLLHKADVGGVITHIHNIDELRISWNKLTQQIESLDPETKKGVKIQIQKEISGGIEVIVGVKRDPNFGPVLLFGAGGKYAEILLDRNLHLLPISDPEARSLVTNSKIYSLLKGFRGDPAYNLDQLYETMIRLGKLVETAPDISEIEINPLIITHTGVWAVDSKVVLTQTITPTFTTPQFKQATTISHKLIADKFHYFLFETSVPISIKSGQFISVKVNDQRINSYSVAGCSDPNHFELLVDVSPQGVGSKYFENLKEGEKIIFLGPAGIFTLKPEDGSQHLIFLGTGSGIAPLKFMIEDALKNRKLTQPITLYFGLRFKEDVFWQDLFDDLTRNYPNFHYKLSLSKPTPEWTGFSGHITDFIKQDFSDASQCSAYLCGNKTMIEESSKLLLECGCPQERVYSEKFY